jgi:hypothetical protein
VAVTWEDSGVESGSLGERFAHSLAAKDRDGLLALIHPEVDFRAMTPRRTWEASEPNEVLSAVFENWFEDSDQIEEIERLDTDRFADRERVGYRFAVSNPEGRFQVEQQAYLSERDGQIGWMRVVCSGYRPSGPVV